MLIFISATFALNCTIKVINGSVHTIGVPVVAPNFTSTEGDYGVNLWPDDEDDKYVLVPSSALFEFIPEDDM